MMRQEQRGSRGVRKSGAGFIHTSNGRIPVNNRAYSMSNTNLKSRWNPSVINLNEIATRNLPDKADVGYSFKNLIHVQNGMGSDPLVIYEESIPKMTGKNDRRIG